MTLPTSTRDPLLHFLGLGFFLYLALTWGGEPVDPSSRRIEIGRAEQAELALAFERVMGRAPTDAELDARISEYVRDEILYREALRLSLDEGDAVVRQRLVAKMDMSASAAAELTEPSESALRAVYEANRERYGGDVRVSFRHAHFSEREKAEAVRDGWNRAPGNVEIPPGARMANLPAAVDSGSQSEVAILFGEQFAGGLSKLEPGEKWQGPIPSAFGWHLVRLERREAQPARFEAVRQRIENDWRTAETAAREARAFEILRNAYTVDIAR